MYTSRFDQRLCLQTTHATSSSCTALHSMYASHNHRLPCNCAITLTSMNRVCLVFGMLFFNMILHHPCPSITFTTIHHSICILLYPSYYFILRFIVMLCLTIHCLHQCSTIKSYIVWMRTTHTIDRFMCLYIVLLYIHHIDASPSIRHVLLCCRRNLDDTSILHPSIAYPIRVNGIDPSFHLSSSIVFLPYIDPDPSSAPKWYNHQCVRIIS